MSLARIFFPLALSPGSRTLWNVSTFDLILVKPHIICCVLCCMVYGDGISFQKRSRTHTFTFILWQTDRIWRKEWTLAPTEKRTRKRIFKLFLESQKKEKKAHKYVSTDRVILLCSHVYLHIYNMLHFYASWLSLSSLSSLSLSLCMYEPNILYPIRAFYSFYHELGRLRLTAWTNIRNKTPIENEGREMAVREQKKKTQKQMYRNSQRVKISGIPFRLDVEFCVCVWVFFICFLSVRKANDPNLC